MQSLITGKSIIIEQTEDELSLEKDGSTIIAQKANTEPSDTGRLEFTQDDFFDDNEEYKYYEDEGNLPWLNSHEMLMGLLDVQYLVYSYSTLIEETEAFDTKTLTADVVANEKEQSRSIDYIFYGYDRYNLPDDANLPPNNEYSEPLYPTQGDLFRISGEEEITCPAGTFECTVVEAMGENENRLKLWMINDIPGVYAKIIDDKPGDWGYFVIFELQEIQ